MPSDIFLDFFSNFGYFSKLPRNGRWNLSGRALFSLPITLFKGVFSSLTFIQTHFRPLLIIFPKFPTPKHSSILLFSFLHSKSLKITLKSLQSQKPQIHSNPNFPFLIRSTMATSRVGPKRKGKAPIQEDFPPHFDHLGKHSTIFQLETSISVGFQISLI